MFKPRAIAIDIDGTITDETRAVNCRAVNVLRKVRVPIILVTGNIMCYARTASKLLGFSDTVIAENGGVVRFGYDEEDVVIGDKERCIRAMRVLSEHFPIEPLDLDMRLSEVAVRRTFSVGEAEKILSAENSGVRIVDSGFAYHITDVRVSKGKALNLVAEKLDIPIDDFMAIGDSENDVEMLESVGFGIAVANAHPSLKRIADYVTESPDGEGVIEALRKAGVL